MSEMKYRQRLFIEGPLPGLNALIAASKRSGWRQGKKGSRWNEYARMKKEWHERIELTAKVQKIKPVMSRASFVFVWFEKDRRRDPDNIAAAGRKFIFDSLIKAGILRGDGWKHVEGWKDEFRVARGARRPGVLIEIQESMLGRIR